MKTDIDLTQRPSGYSSRVRPGAGRPSTWIAGNGQSIDLPLIVDHVNIDPKSGKSVWYIEARIDLVADQPELIDIRLSGEPHLDTILLQRFFRWATPLDIVRRTVPSLLAKGLNPFEYEYATDGYPDAAEIGRKPTTTLSDGFLKEIARQYVEIGRGYARIIAQQRGVSDRTVVSWVQKARKRGFLAKTTSGRRTYEVLASEQEPNET